MPQITQSILKNICPNLFLDRAASLAVLINQIAPKYKVDTAARLQAFIAQVAHESGEFSIKTENMNYTTPARLVSIWPSRFTITDEKGKLNANDYVKNAEKLANEVYANRMGNGNQASGDGFKFRGGGFLQLTGKESYQAYAKYLNKSIDETSKLVHETDQYALDAAFWEFSVNKNLNNFADQGDFITITKRINGATIGLAERQKYYQRCKKYII